MDRFKINRFEIYKFSCQKPIRALFFAHANGIPAQTYRSFLQGLSHDLQAVIYAYDMRGIGRTEHEPFIKEDTQHEWLWELLARDHLSLFERLQEREYATTHHLPWMLMGHSFGAWMSLITSWRVGVKELFLLDPPILPLKIMFMWTIAVLSNKRQYNRMSEKVRKRKTMFPSEQVALESLRKTTLMQRWNDQTILDYINGCFLQKEEGLHLRHSPNWEAAIYESMPVSATIGFLKIPRSYRKKITPYFLVGADSNTCNPRAGNYVKSFFPRAQWILIPNESHMFPIESPETTSRTIVEHIKFRSE
jgi:pimeloyl-ACP methyl ester carboxylesterase